MPPTATAAALFALLHARLRASPHALPSRPPPGPPRVRLHARPASASRPAPASASRPAPASASRPTRVRPLARVCLGSPALLSPLCHLPLPPPPAAHLRGPLSPPSHYGRSSRLVLFWVFWALRRRVCLNVPEKQHPDRQTHDVDDTAGAALTWKWPELGSDRPERVATSTWSRSGPAPNTDRGLSPRAGTPGGPGPLQDLAAPGPSGRPGRQHDEEEPWPTTRTTAIA